MTDLWIAHYHVNADTIAYICDYRDRETPEIHVHFIGGRELKFSGGDVAKAIKAFELPDTAVEPEAVDEPNDVKAPAPTSFAGAPASGAMTTGDLGAAKA